MPPKCLWSSPEMTLILSANRFRTGASNFPISSAKIHKIFGICKSKWNYCAKKSARHCMPTKKAASLTLPLFFLSRHYLAFQTFFRFIFLGLLSAVRTIHFLLSMMVSNLPFMTSSPL